MALPLASQVYLGDGSTWEEPLEIYIPKQTAIDKIGGIFCHICNSTFGNKKDFDSHYAHHNTGSNEIVYTCVECKKQISGYPSFRGHCYLKHVMKDKFQCKHCSKSFSKLAALNSHITNVHEFKCSFCDEKFISKRDLQTHKIIHSKKSKDEPPYDCLSCGKLLKTVEVCESHINDHYKVLYPCPICTVVLPDKLEATKHLTKHFDEDVPDDISTTPTCSEDSSIDMLGGILCCHCDLLFRNRAEFDEHFLAEHEDKTIVYSCNICGKQYDKYSMFGNHCYFHYSKDKFRCDQCYKTFDRLSLLVIHTEAFHSEGAASDKPFRCEQCGRRFTYHNRLFEHRRIVHEQSSIRCMKLGCSATFDTPKDLILHQKQHNAPDNWCRQCGLHFSNLASCERHLDVHCRKNYTCPICTRVYHEKYLMVKHVPVHFETVLHVCKICGKVYNARNRFVQHLKTHSDLRNYKCTYCDKGFLRPYELQQHLNIHTGRRPYTCTICPKAFASYPNWCKHLTKTHNLDKKVVKELRAAQDSKATGDTKIAKVSSVKAESGIESAGSEMSLDVYAFAESDDSTSDSKEPRKTWPVKKENSDEMKIHDPISGDDISITDTVNAVIDRIDTMDEDLDLAVGKGEFNAVCSEFSSRVYSLDDGSDIKAIVEHIDAMSGELERAEPAAGASAAGNVAGSGDVQFAQMTPVDNAIYNTIPVAEAIPEMQYLQPIGCPPEYGPDFSQGAEAYDTGFINLDDHCLPHIDPLLTIKAEEDAKKYVNNINNYTFESPPLRYETQTWEPIIAKVLSYEEASDVNRMYVLNTNIF